MAAGPMVSGPLFFKAAFACPAEDEFAPQSGKPDVGGRAKQRPGPSILKSGRLPRAAAKMPHPKFVRMASENFNPAITFHAVAVDEKEDYWETTADILKRAWRPPWKRFACMYRPTPGYLRDDDRPGNIFRDGERGVDYSPTYHPFYSTLSRVAARSRALSLASVVRTEIDPRPPGSREDLRPAVGITGDGSWIYTGGWDDDLKDRPPARTLSAFKLKDFTQINDADPEYDPEDFVHIEVPDIQPWWTDGAQLLNDTQYEYRKGGAEFKALVADASDDNHLGVYPEPAPHEEQQDLAEACPSSSSRRRKRKAKRAREQQRLLNISPAAWGQRLSAQQVAEKLAEDRTVPEGGAPTQPTSVQNIFDELSFDPDEPLDLRSAPPLKEAGGMAKESATKGEPGQPGEPKAKAPSRSNTLYVAMRVELAKKA